MTAEPAEGRLTKAQRAVLEAYEASGVTAQPHGHMNTWKALLRRGLLRRSNGPGFIETEITDLGRAALAPSQ